MEKMTNWSMEKLLRKLDQHQEMQSLALSDKDHQDAERHRKIAEAIAAEIASRK